MITLLQIENFALIEHLRLELDRGLTVLTGETGSGKSIVLDALTFLFGARANTDLVREGASRAVVEAELTIDDGSAAGEWLASRGYRDDGHPGQTVLRRELNSAGRSRAQINGRLATVGELAELGGHLVEVHLQGGEHALLSVAAQRELFDELAGCGDLLHGVARAHETLSTAMERRESLRQLEREAAARMDYLRYAVDELEGTAIIPGEPAALRAERERLAHADAIRSGTAGAAESLSSDGGASASKLVARAYREVERLASVDPSLVPISRQLAEVSAMIEDVAASLVGHAESVEADPDRILEIDERLDVLRKVLRKHGPTEGDALAKLEGLRAELQLIEGRGGEASRLDDEIEDARGNLAHLCGELAAKRRRHLPPFEAELVRALRELAMPAAAISVEFPPVADGIELADGRRACKSGTEGISISFSANAGEAMLPLRRVASGGELSRLILALKSLAASAAGVPILLFDEVDAGLSGAAASCVGRALAGLGQGRQVLCVTHQAAVAAFASSHIAVTKAESAGRTLVAVEELAQRGRERELARLLDGGADSRSGRRLAQELLDRAAS